MASLIFSFLIGKQFWLKWVSLWEKMAIVLGCFNRKRYKYMIFILNNYIAITVQDVTEEKKFV
jgi:hypothetical protein